MNLLATPGVSFNFIVPPIATTNRSRPRPPFPQSMSNKRPATRDQARSMLTAYAPNVQAVVQPMLEAIFVKRPEDPASVRPRTSDSCDPSNTRRTPRATLGNRCARSGPCARDS